MVFDLDLIAVQSAAKDSVAATGYAATAATLATVATKSAQSVATVATVAAVASSHGLATSTKQPTPAPARPLSKWSVYAPWRAADRAYQTHHWQCATCRAAARSAGHSTRCAAGQQLYAAYEQAAPAGGAV